MIFTSDSLLNTLEEKISLSQNIIMPHYNKYSLQALLALLLTVCTYAGDQRPNILFLLVDDLGARDLSCYGSDFYETPAIDALAEAGMTFQQAYAAHPRCVPSRYAIQTGVYPARDGVPGNSYELRGDRMTIGQAFQKAGYKTFFAGKWHLGKTEDQFPAALGYDVSFAAGKPGAPRSYFAPYNVARDKHHEAKTIPGVDDAPEGEHLPDRLTEATARFIREHVTQKPDQPFFAMLSYYSVHTPLMAKEETTAKYAKKLKTMETPERPEGMLKDGYTKLRQDVPVYAAMIEHVDDSVERLINLLEELGLRENTIVVLTSDHGGLSNRGAKSQRSLATTNYPMRAGKGHLYEGGIRIPQIVSWPKKITGGTTTHAVTSNTDYYPTLLELVGATAPEGAGVDAQSFAEVLTGSINYERTPIVWYSPRPRPNSTGDEACAAIREGNYKLLYFFKTDHQELYDIDKDPSESNNLASAMPEKAEAMHQALREWLKQNNAIEPTLN